MTVLSLDAEVICTWSDSPEGVVTDGHTLPWLLINRFAIVSTYGRVNNGFRKLGG